MQDVLNIVGGNRGNMSHQAAERRTSEAVLQFTNQSCPMATGLYLKLDTYTRALLRNPPEMSCTS